MKLGFLTGRRKTQAEPVVAEEEEVVVEAPAVLEPLEPEVDGPGPEIQRNLKARGLTLQRSREVVIHERTYVELKLTNGTRELVTLAEWKI